MNDLILMAASQEMNEHGLKFTMKNVAQRLGISKKTLYQHFPSKDALISSVIEAHIADIASQQEELIAKGGEFEDVLKAAIILRPQRVADCSTNVREEIIKYRPQDWAKLLAFFDERARGLVCCLDCGKELGYIRPIHTEVAACMLYSIADGLFQQNFLEKNNLTFADAFKAAVDIFLYGIISKQTDL
jgi:AcrR family transcriptional regulator